MMSGSEIMSGTPRPVAGADAHAAPDLGRLVHSVINSTAAITFSANALRAPGHLTESSLEALARIEQSAKLVADAVKTFATALRDAPAPPSDEGAGVNLYDVCCEIAAQRRVAGGRAISCHAVGDSRGRWKRAQVTGLVTLLVDTALAHLDRDARVTLAVTGVRRHVRLDMRVRGSLSARGKAACLEIPSRVDPSLGGLMMVTLLKAGGTLLSMHLPR